MSVSEDLSGVQLRINHHSVAVQFLGLSRLPCQRRASSVPDSLSYIETCAARLIPSSERAVQHPHQRVKYFQPESV